MKKYFYSAVVGLMAMLTASCSQDEDVASVVKNNEPVKATFTLRVPSEHSLTRAADTNVKRYAIAIENVDDPTATWDVDLIGEGDDSKKMLIQASNEFTIDGLTPGSKYIAYFWADYDEASAGWSGGAYDISWYNWIGVNWNATANGYVAGMAYCGKKEFTAGEDKGAGFTVTLNRVVAKVNLVQSPEGISNGETLVVGYNTKIYYNIKTKSVVANDSDPSTEAVDDYNISHSKTIAAGSIAANTELNTFYVLASDAGETVDFYFTTDNWATSTPVTNVPVKANYQTNIKGSYFLNYNASQAVFTVSADDTWGGTNPDSTF